MEILLPVENGKISLVLSPEVSVLLPMNASSSASHWHIYCLPSVGTDCNQSMQDTLNSLRYRPNVDFSGYDTMVLRVRDNNEETSKGFYIRVNPVNDPPRIALMNVVSIVYL